MEPMIVSPLIALLAVFVIAAALEHAHNVSNRRKDDES